MQLSDAGRDSVTRRMWGAGKESSANDVGGGGLVNVGVGGDMAERWRWVCSGELVSSF